MSNENVCNCEKCNEKSNKSNYDEQFVISDPEQIAMHYLAYIKKFTYTNGVDVLHAILFDYNKNARAVLTENGILKIFNCKINSVQIYNNLPVFDITLFKDEHFFNFQFFKAVPFYSMKYCKFNNKIDKGVVFLPSENKKKYIARKFKRIDNDRMFIYDLNASITKNQILKESKFLKNCYIANC